MPWSGPFEPACGNVAVCLRSLREGTFIKVGDDEVKLGIVSA